MTGKPRKLNVRKFYKRESLKRGLTPGTMVHIGESRRAATKITVFLYDEGKVEEKEVKNIEEVVALKDTSHVVWINIDGLVDTALIERIGQIFALHPLSLEDIVNTGQRPKLEDYGEYVFVVLKMLSYQREKKQVESEQVSLVLGKNFVLSFQEDVGDVFDVLRQRLRSGKGRLRKMGADYLFYSLLDAVVDEYFVILEHVGEEMEAVEIDLVNHPSSALLHNIHDLKQEMLFLRKSVWPLREVVSSLERQESSLVSPTTTIYLRDIYDHIIQVIDTVEIFRDMLAGMLEIYLSSISYRINEVMKVLTIIATIFMPCTFLAGLYGMNFNTAASPWNMPELNWRYGYLFAWGVILTVSVTMLVYFKRKKWF